MAHMPVEVVDVGDIPAEPLNRAITLANSLQTEFFFDRLPDAEAGAFRTLSYRQANATQLLNEIDAVRKQLRGYHPFLIAFIDAELKGDRFSNLFAARRSRIGLGIVTVCNVIDLIIPRDRVTAYFLYYLSHQTLRFIVPYHQNHDDTRGCVFDRKIDKPDLIVSMRSRALCDECRASVLNSENLSPRQLAAANKLYEVSGAFLRNGPNDATVCSDLRIFIGSSSEGLRVANEIHSQFRNEFDVEVWNQGTVFGLGTSTLEALEEAVLSYDFGIFVFTPDDEVYVRGQVNPVARDNVVFELGLFAGKLSRKRAFIVQPKRGVVLPSDLNGITTASYDSSRSRLSASLRPACETIRNAIARELHRTNEQADLA